MVDHTHLICFGVQNCVECAIITRFWSSSFLVQFGSRWDKCLVKFLLGGTGEKSLECLDHFSTVGIPISAAQPRGCQWWRWEDSDCTSVENHGTSWQASHSFGV